MTRKPYRELLTLSKDCELAVRVKDGVKYFFLLNYTGATKRATIRRPMIDLERQEKVSGELSLMPYEVKVLKYEG